MAIEIKEYLREDGKLEYRALYEGHVIMADTDRRQLIKRLRKKAGI